MWHSTSILEKCIHSLKRLTNETCCTNILLRILYFKISDNHLCAFNSNKGKILNEHINSKLINLIFIMNISLKCIFTYKLLFLQVLLWGKFSLLSSTSYLIYFNWYWWHVCSCLLQEGCHLTERCSTHIKRQPQPQSAYYPFWSKNRARWKQTRDKVAGLETSDLPATWDNEKLYKGPCP